MGPTASGKTAIACDLVELYPFEIISVDSAMIYKEMDIGTAKPDATTLAKAPHHLIDIVAPTERYSAAQFCNDVNELIETCHQKNRIPLLVGGTMMYFKSLQQGLSNLPESNPTVRENLLKLGLDKGWPALHKRLASVDMESAKRIHPHDAQRIQRALEVYELSGKPMSEYFHAVKHKAEHQFVNIMLTPCSRKWLHERIAIRFHEMIEQGFIEEVEQLIQKWDLKESHPSMKSVGYRQAWLYLHGKLSKDELIDKGIVATRQLAKRQLTWLRHWPEGYYFEPDNEICQGEIVALIKKMLDNTDQKNEEL